MVEMVDTSLEQVAMTIAESQAPIFVVGTQRSGTTLLCRMLSAHPNLFVLNEMNEACENITMERETSDVVASIDAEFKLKTQFGIREYLEKQGKRRWGLKHPALTYCLDALKEHFPESKIIFIVRDGRAVANSYLKAGWGVANMYGAGERWTREIELQREFWNNHPSVSCMLKYEDLLADPAKELARVCACIGEPFEESMMTFYNEPSPIKENVYNTNVFRPIDRSIEYKWKKELSPYQVEVFEDVAGEDLQALGYSLVNDGARIPFLTKLWLKWHQKIFGEMQLQYQWRVKPFFKSVFH